MGAGSVPAAAARDGGALGERAGGARAVRRRPLGALVGGGGAAGPSLGAGMRSSPQRAVRGRAGP